MNKEENSKLYISLLLSILIHLSFVLIAFVLSNLFKENFEQSGYVVLSTVKGISSPDISKLEKEFESKKNEESPLPDEQPKLEDENKDSGNPFLLDAAGSDTSTLNQVYTEKTLNVKIRYPVGWVYLDQQNKKKLDGVTFWAAEGAFDPPPYIHLEVTDKYYFNPQKFKYSYKFKNFTGFYNEPEELEDQISQVLYIRTETEYDFTFKLIMKGKRNFDSFKPVFFAMVNSFHFGSDSWF
ncbi:MAG: hypothetical protein C4539_12460 [Ignavibacteriales bacterium]|nr:MAG: hypothetical protein C4539_12460 [Ignavibacteriales bacterium]